jgi:hypothetical protein
MPQFIRTKVISGWPQGTSRTKIARDNDIGAGTKGYPSTGQKQRHS